MRKSTTVLKFTLQVIVSQLRKRMIFLANAKMFAVCLAAHTLLTKRRIFEFFALIRRFILVPFLDGLM